MIGCLIESTTCVVAKPIVIHKTAITWNLKCAHCLKTYKNQTFYTVIHCNTVLYTSGFATTHVVVSVRHPITY